MKTIREDIEILSTLFVNEWNKANRPSNHVNKNDINSGWCYQFALVLRQYFGSQAKLITDDGHAWVRVGNTYYDSDNPRGVTVGERGMGLCGSSFCHELSPVSLHDLVKRWSGWDRGGSGPIQPTVIISTIRSFRERKNIVSNPP